MRKRSSLYTFLTTQHEDLIKEEDRPHRVINRINASKRRRCSSETLEKIREGNFRTMFVELFGGGKRTLKLVEEDPLEAGIDISPGLPGSNRSITLLSGGGQTMIPVALLF